MLEGTIKLHGEAGTGKDLLLKEIEGLLKNPKYRNLKITCRVQEPAKPQEVRVVFKKGAQGLPLNSNWHPRDEG